MGSRRPRYMLQEPVRPRRPLMSNPRSANRPLSFLSTFFSLGQVLPTHRLWYSPSGGLYQPTMARAIQLLSGPRTTSGPLADAAGSSSFPSPVARAGNHHAWVHVFPEACCHQGVDGSLRYFKWGISRLILETDPAPQFIPMFIHGTQDIVPEERGWPRFLPRVGKRVRVVVGEPASVAHLFGHHRAAWKRLTDRYDEEQLRTHPEAVQLRIDVAKSVRDEVQKLRQSLGFPREEDETAAMAETWSKEPNKRRFKSPVDGSLINRI
ncbi:tafazzin [Drechmeria coniospora]|uniref:Tafazzin family protein n=1 Tax=Drechmeria coniospora TaxID=98403 RepID=A0A151GC01_DRECN|nr:tafazzin [Drechmeria coniospora]KYK54575.1 tafazzin [Drechmeria coniospora]